MFEIIQETLMDSIKILPFLFFTYLLMEYIEHKTTKKTKDMIKKSGKIGPLVGGVVGAFPQCGFSVSAANLYAGRVISIGTLIAIFLSTSDEMLPILISNGTNISVILKIIGIKVIVGITVGFLIDYILRKKNSDEKNKIHDMCKEEHCHCEKSILKSTIKHTISIFIFIVITSFILNSAVTLIGEEYLSKLFMQNTIFGPMIAGVIGIIPNCAASVVITELYLSSTITLGSVIAGLLSGAGIGLAVLFKVNKDIKENLKILGIVYLIGVIVGIIIDTIGIII